MPPTNYPTAPEYIANQVSFEYARLRAEGVKKIDFSQLLINVIRGNGINDPNVVSYLRKETAQVFAQRRAKRTGGQQSFHFRSVKGKMG